MVEAWHRTGNAKGMRALAVLTLLVAATLAPAIAKAQATAQPPAQAPAPWRDAPEGEEEALLPSEEAERPRREQGEGDASDPSRGGSRVWNPRTHTWVAHGGGSSTSGAPPSTDGAAAGIAVGAGVAFVLGPAFIALGVVGEAFSSSGGDFNGTALFVLGGVMTAAGLGIMVASASALSDINAQRERAGLALRLDPWLALGGPARGGGLTLTLQWRET